MNSKSLVTSSDYLFWKTSDKIEKQYTMQNTSDCVGLAV